MQFLSCVLCFRKYFRNTYTRGYSVSKYEYNYEYVYEYEYPSKFKFKPRGRLYHQINQGKGILVQNERWEKMKIRKWSISNFTGFEKKGKRMSFSISQVITSSLLFLIIQYVPPNIIVILNMVEK